jgi:hypothetical protein
MLPNIPNFPGVQWKLTRDFWRGLTPQTAIQVLKARGWDIQNDDKNWKNSQQDWSSDQNVSFNYRDGIVIRVTKLKPEKCCQQPGMPNSMDASSTVCGDCGDTALALSGELQSPNWFGPGDYLEIKAQIPATHGLWPALWCNNEVDTTWPAGGEIDLLEHGGWFDPEQNFITPEWDVNYGNLGLKGDSPYFYSTVHCSCCPSDATMDTYYDCGSIPEGYPPCTSDQPSDTGHAWWDGCGCAGGNGRHLAYNSSVGESGADLEMWHTYGCYWTKDGNKVYIFLDGKLLKCDTNCAVSGPDVTTGNGVPCGNQWGNPMQVIMNIAIGGWMGGSEEKNPYDQSVWPNTYLDEWEKHPMKIKYGRIWKNVGQDITEDIL